MKKDVNNNRMNENVNNKDVNDRNMDYKHVKISKFMTRPIEKNVQKIFFLSCFLVLSIDRGVQKTNKAARHP